MKTPAALGPGARKARIFWTDSVVRGLLEQPGRVEEEPRGAERHADGCRADEDGHRPAREGRRRRSVGSDTRTSLRNANSRTTLGTTHRNPPRVTSTASERASHGPIGIIEEMRRGPS